MHYVKRHVYFNFCIFLSIFKVGYSVPIEYCLQALNKSDCKVAPTPVFSYYKPGSRCEMEIWRGCPTMNKFDNEYECSHFCIAKLFKFQYTSENFLSAATPDDKPQLPVDPCIVEINTTQCLNQSTEVFTYKNGTCEKAIWRGCATVNKFDKEISCQDTCVKENLQDWKKKLQQLSHAEVKEIDNILNDLVNDTTTVNIDEEVTSIVNTEVPTTEPTTIGAVVEETATRIDTTTAVGISATVTMEMTTETVKPTEESSGDADEVIVT